PAAADQRTAPPFPTPPVLEEPFATAFEELVADARAQSADIASFAAQMLRRLNNPAPDEHVSLFLSQRDNPLKTAQVAKTLLAGARIPTRIAHGIELRGEPRSASIQAWLEVYNGDRWLYFDPLTANQFAAGDLLTWYYGDSALVSVTNARRVETDFYIQRNIVDSMAVAERRASALGSHAMEFSLFNLPVRTQAVYAVLLLIPLGGIVMVLMRNIIGVPTFGMFTPILIALAFRETRLLYGLILFSLVVALGLAVRFYLEKLHLLLAPRLAAVLTVVVILMLMISILSHRLDLETGLSIALFPMVILTMVIERMSIVWEERGPATAVKEGVGSLLVAMVAYFVMSIDQLEHLLFVFPELLLVLLGICLLLGQYTGYRLTELARFSALSKSKSS
ncbi:MAG: UUP1 family membrane protein, partial [Arenicella sp.]|nr:UUP1 family membrane protein [Arenicella sp.]